MTKDEIIQENIRKFREATGLTQEQLAQALDKSTDAVRSWEQGKKTPDLDSLMALGEFFGRPLDDFPNPNPPPRKAPNRPPLEYRFNRVADAPDEFLADVEAFNKKWTPERLAAHARAKAPRATVNDAGAAAISGGEKIREQRAKDKDKDNRGSAGEENPRPPSRRPR